MQQKSVFCLHDTGEDFYAFNFYVNIRIKCLFNFYNSVGWSKKFSELYFSHFQVDWMILFIYCFVISHIVQNPAADTPNKVTNHHMEALIGPVVATGLWLVTLLWVSRHRCRSMWKITKQYLNKSNQSTWKWLKYSPEKFLR